MNSGYFFCPYVPLLSTPPVMDPNAVIRRALSQEELADLEVWRNPEAEEELAQDLHTMTSTANTLCRRQSSRVNWMKDGF